MDFSTRIQRIAGIDGNSILSSWLSESAREIITLLPEDRAYSCSTEIVLPQAIDNAIQLYAGNNEVSFSSVPNTPNDGISQMLGSIEPLVSQIVGPQVSAFQISPGKWGGSMTKFEANTEVPYVLTLTNDVLWVTLYEDAVFETSGQSISSLNTDTYRIMNVVRNNGSLDYPCRKINAIDKGKASVNSGYFNEATEYDPCYYIENNRLTVIPTPTMEYKVKISAVLFPEINKADEKVDNFPDEFEHLLILSAAKKAKMYQISEANKEEDFELATSHINQLAVINQEFQAGLQLLVSGGTQQIQEKGATE
jgi:hypothetical protein